MVVTLGTLDLHPHEDPRDLAGHLDGPGLVRQRECHGAVLVVAAGGRDHPRDDRIPGVLACSRLASQSSSASNRTRFRFSLVAWNAITSRQ